MGLAIATPRAIPNDNINIFQKLLLYAISENNIAKKTNIIHINVFLLYLSAISAVKKFNTYGIRITANTIAICDNESSFLIATIGINRNHI